jgi:hypothetical protein
MEGSREFATERRRCLRQMVHAPAFASFDGVTGGMILDLSEEGLSMQTGTGIDGNNFEGKSFERDRRVRLDVDLSEPAVHMETTGYIAGRMRWGARACASRSCPRTRGGD